MDELNKRLDTLQDQVKHQQKWQEELDQQLKEITDTIRALTEPSRKRKAPDTVTDHEHEDTQPLTQEEDKSTVVEIVEDLVELGKDVVKHFTTQ
jgi:predicted transcriptional regulator